jgi:protein-S-isoprenylcysteine O-methyltransferase Ste14
MPPDWLPLAALLAIIGLSAWRVRVVARKHGVTAFAFTRHAPIQSVAERHWKMAVFAALAAAALTWLAPNWETALARPDWATLPTLRWLSALIFIASVALIAVAQIQMGASWRVGVPAEGPGALVSHGIFRWSRNPIFAGMIGASFALLIWSPHVVTAAIFTLTWTLSLIQVRIEEEALREKHGDAYEHYAAHVGRWFGRDDRPLGRLT